MTDIITSLSAHRKSLDISSLRNTHVHYFTPCYGGLLTEGFFRSWSKTHIMFTKNEIPYSQTTTTSESLITRARCHMVAYFMANPAATHMMFIDADISFDPADILHMIQHDKDVIVGAYPKKEINWPKVSAAVKQRMSAEQARDLAASYAVNFEFATEDTTKRELVVSKGLIKLKDAGTGFMLIKRSVIEKMIAAYPDLYFNNDLGLPAEVAKWTYLFFDCMHEPATKRYLSEDYAFCRRWQNIGGEVWLDPLVKLDHHGSYTYKGNVGSLFNT